MYPALSADCNDARDIPSRVGRTPPRARPRMSVSPRGDSVTIATQKKDEGYRSLFSTGLLEKAIMTWRCSMGEEMASAIRGRRHADPAVPLSCLHGSRVTSV